SMRQTSPTASTGRRISHPASRIPIGCPFASSSTATRWGAFRDRSLSVLLRVPPSAFRVCSRFIVDQRIPPLREPRPRLHLDDVVEQRALEPELDLLGGAPQRATSPGARRRLCVAREQLQLRGAGDERGELDDQPLHPAGRSHSRRPARPNCDTTASSGSAASAPSVLMPSCSSRRCVSGSSGRTASRWEARNFASPPTGTMTASPGLARVAATQETNFPRPHPTRNAERGSGNAEQASELSSSVPRSAFRIPRFIISTISSGPPYNPSSPSVPTYALPSSTG